MKATLSRTGSLVGLCLGNQRNVVQTLDHEYIGMGQRRARVWNIEKTCTS
jgi:hypothetical protein